MSYILKFKVFFHSSFWFYHRSMNYFLLGNICRSPIAEAVFLDLIEKNGTSAEWKVDSGAIGPWHVGKSAERRALETLKSHGINYNRKARQVCTSIIHYHKRNENVTLVSIC